MLQPKWRHVNGQNFLRIHLDLRIAHVAAMLLERLRIVGSTMSFKQLLQWGDWGLQGRVPDSFLLDHTDYTTQTAMN